MLASRIDIVVLLPVVLCKGDVAAIVCIAPDNTLAFNWVPDILTLPLSS